MLWCHGAKQSSKSAAAGSKRQRSPESQPAQKKPQPAQKKPQPAQKKPQPAQKKSRYSTHSEKMAEVSIIEEELLEIHDGQYSGEQIHAWANLIQMGKHTSYECAPKKQFWKKPSGTKCSSPAMSESVVTVSPGKKVQLQGQLIDQLLKWHDLLEKGGIDQTQYDEMQSNIMKDVKKF